MENNHDFYQGETPANYEQKCPVVFVLDRSISMRRAIDELNKGLEKFEQELIQDSVAAARLDIAVISFGDDYVTERDFGLIDSEPMPKLTVKGTTKLVDATRAAIEKIRARKEWYRKSGQTCYRAFLILITDGYPDHDQDVKGLAREIEDLAKAKSMNFWPIAVKGADMEMLKTIAADKYNGSFSPMMLQGIEFVKLFQWLSDSFKIISNSKEGEAADITPNKDNNAFQLVV